MRRTASRSAPATAPTAWPRRIDEACAAGDKAAREAGGNGRRGREAQGRRRRDLDRRHARRRPGRRRRHDGQGLRRFPERRDRQGHPARRARGHALDRARQALHHQRHGDRPGQDLQHARPGHRRRDAGQGRSREVGLTTFRAPYTPVTFGAIVGHARGAAVRSDAHDADPCLGGGARRGVRGCRPVEARLVFPAGRRGHARGRQPRMQDGARGRPACSTPRRSARSRSSARTRPKFMDLLYTNPWEKLEPGRCRYGIMLREDGFIYDDGVVGRLAPDRFHVTTTTGGAPRVHEPHGGLSPDRVPASQGLADLDHRAVGGDRRAGAEGARDHRAAGRGHRHVGRGACRTCRCARARSAACRRGCSACRSPASAASRSTCRPTTARPSGKRCGPRARSTAPAPTAPRRCTCCAPRRATSSSARTPTAR